MLEVNVYDVNTLQKATMGEYRNHEALDARAQAISLAGSATPNQRVIVMSDGWLPIFEPTTHPQPVGGWLD